MTHPSTLIALAADAPTPVASLLGGILIGISAAALLLFSGRIAGITGVVAGALRPKAGDLAWRLWFLAGLVGGGALLGRLSPEAFAGPVEQSVPATVAAGLLVGFGTRLGNGCTSGHGVCGIGRLSKRSLVATVVFVAVAALSVLVRRSLRS
jgi:uncharacterized membrane protein YedE/YeeE